MSSPARRFGWSTPCFVSLAVLSGAACGPGVTQSPVAVTAVAQTVAEQEKAIAEVLDDWHDAAARADEGRYFGHLTESAVFLGTDAAERWDKKAFLAYAHPHFFNGKAWNFHATRRSIVLAPGGQSAWFDEDLATEKLGPARGSGALVKLEDGWKISLYNLSIPIPNDRFDAVRKIIAGGDAAPGQAASTAPGLAEVCATATPGSVCGVVDFTGTPPVMKEPGQRKDADFCKLDHVVHDSVLVQEGRLQDVVIRVVSGLKAGAGAAKPAKSVDIHQRKCMFAPRVATAMVGQTVRFLNDDATLHNVHAYAPDGSTWFNQAQPRGAAGIEKDLDEEGVAVLMDDVHPWMTGFVVVSPHRFITITGASGVFTLQGLPDGKYGIEAWHSIYGTKKAVVTVKGDDVTTLAFTYTGKEGFAAENKRAAEDVKRYP